jgi:hypothetical protein
VELLRQPGAVHHHEFSRPPSRRQRPPRRPTAPRLPPARCGAHSQRQYHLLSGRGASGPPGAEFSRISGATTTSRTRPFARGQRAASSTERADSSSADPLSAFPNRPISTAVCRAARPDARGQPCGVTAHPHHDQLRSRPESAFEGRGAPHHPSCTRRTAPTKDVSSIGRLRAKSGDVRPENLRAGRCRAGHREMNGGQACRRCPTHFQWRRDFGSRRDSGAPRRFWSLSWRCGRCCFGTRLKEPDVEE